MKKALIAVFNVWILVLASLVFVFAITTYNACADTIYVDGSYIGPEDGSQLFPYNTIQEGVDNANPGDTVYVISGTYVENVAVNLTINLAGEDKNTTIVNGSYNGDVIIVNADWVNITGITVSGSGYNIGDAGIELNSVHDCLIYNNIFYSNPRYGVYLESSSSNNITNNNFSNNEWAIYLSGSSNNNIIGNNLSWNSYSSIYLHESPNNLIEGNNISTGGNGIYLADSSDNDVKDNTISSNSGSGTTLYKSSDINLINNTFTNDGVLIIGIALWHFNTHNIPTDNTVNGKPLYYFKDCSNMNIDGISVGQIIFANCVDIEVRNLKINNTDAGIELGFCENVRIIGNNISYGGMGIYLRYSNNVDVIGNTFLSNEWDGVRLYSSSSNNIIGNNIISNNMEGIDLSYSNDNSIKNNRILNNIYDGLLLYQSSRNNISKNNISSNNNHAMYIHHYSGSNQITRNHIAHNVVGGVFLAVCWNNSVFHNNIINNSEQAFDDGNNHWNTSYPAGGNYWGDYSGIDDYSGPGQNESGSDDIGDSPYVIDVNSQDEYPFIEPIQGIILPLVQLLSPANNSVIRPGVFIDFQIFDDNPLSVNFSVNGGTNNTLSEPYDIYTEGWGEGEFTVQINVMETTGYSQSSWYFFTIDSTKPMINLNTPENNSIIPGGTTLDLSITDANLMQVNYSLNGGDNLTFSEPYNISTTGWNDGGYIVQINALDLADNSNSSWYDFTLDSSPPLITLNEPGNNSFITKGTLIDFSVFDVSLLHTNYSINGGAEIPFSEPFNISTLGWNDGDYIIRINAEDALGRSNSTWYLFSIDSSRPVIILNSPQNSSVIPSGTPLDFSISDIHLIDVNHSINGETDTPLFDPYEVSTIGWSDGGYTVQINALDSAGNSNRSSFDFTLDSTRPIIVLNDPDNNSIVPQGIKLDFSIADGNLDNVTYSLNGGSQTPLSDPYDISTEDWMDGEYTIIINALDLAGNSNSSWFLFLIDSMKPAIHLNSPNNNSFIPSGTLLDFSVIDSNLMHANYSINGGANIPLYDPFNISTAGLPDGDYMFRINAVDLAGNTSSSWYFLRIDSTMPTILMVSPGNDSIIPAGAALNFSIADENLMHVNYSINKAAEIPLPDPFNIPTDGWIDGNYLIALNASDLAGNFDSVRFNITIDSTPPEITLNSPQNNSMIAADETIDIIILDTHLWEVTLSENNRSAEPLSHPFNIETNEWQDGVFTVTIHAVDFAGNENAKWFLFTKDTTRPEITLNSPDNNSVLMEPTILDFDVFDGNLKIVGCSINYGTFNDFDEPYDLDTAGWEDGTYVIMIMAEDGANQTNEKQFVFGIDTAPPSVISTIPDEEAIDVSIEAEIIIDFNEPMDPESVESAITITPHMAYSVMWENDNKTMILNLSSPLEYETLYVISISIDAEDLAGWGLDTGYEFEFTTEAKPKGEKNGGEFPIIYLLLALIPAIIAAFIIVYSVTAKKKKISEEAIPVQVESPQTIHVTCSNCNNLLQVNDIGVTMNVTCPSCSALLTVESRKTKVEEPQPQQPTIQISCPSCSHAFTVMKTEGATQVQCPSCGTSGVLK